MERHFKGIANHYRIALMLSIDENEGMTLDELIARLHANQKTISEHTRRLVHAGLIYKTYMGRQVAHNLSPYGKLFVRFIKTLQQS